MSEPLKDLSFEPLTPTAYLDRAAAAHGDRVAVVDGDARWTYAELHDRCRRLAGALRRCADGRPVAVLAPNTHVLLEANFGVPWAGVPLVAVNTRLSARRGRLHPRALARRRCWCTTRCSTSWSTRRRQTDAAAAADPGRGPSTRSCWPSGRAAGEHAGRRAVAALDQLHERHHRPAQGRDVPPPRRLPAGAGDGGAHRALAVVGAPVDAADVPLQRLVFPLGGDRRRRRRTSACAGRAGRDLAADPRGGRHPPERRADGAVDDRLRAARRAPIDRDRCASPPAARRRRRRSCAGWPSWASTSRTCTG